ncbi:unnamed protein product [Calicophoron daubneyi]|uniref:CWH43-like N-terminal domain-containing protein n=1 Tax=Calicophoron daubneyi TaxID=300641 RepID=A0AAV2TA33_CALDB
MVWFHLHHLPVAICVTLVLAFGISYAISAGMGQVCEVFPFISDTGTFPPASCVFGQLLNIGACLAAVTMYVWYTQQLDQYENAGNPRWHTTYAKVSLGFGLISALGISLVGNFQETSQFVMHIIGAEFTFVLGTVYSLLIGHATRVHLNSPKWLKITRISLSIVALVCCVFMIVVPAVVGGELVSPLDPKKPCKELGLHRKLCVTFEWLLAFSFFAFLLTMSYELRDYKLEPIKVKPRPRRNRQQTVNEEDDLESDTSEESEA